MRRPAVQLAQCGTGFDAGPGTAADARGSGRDVNKRGCRARRGFALGRIAAGYEFVWVKVAAVQISVVARITNVRGGGGGRRGQLQGVSAADNFASSRAATAH